MTATLAGRNTRTLITSLEVLSDDEKQVLMIDRQEDGSVAIKTRAPHENYWSSNSPRYTVKAKDTRFLSQLFGSQDVYNPTYLDEIPDAKINREAPREVIEAELAAKPAECSELDIERAKAANIAEQRKLIELDLSKDHARELHTGYQREAVDGCPMCDKRIRPGYGDGSLRPDLLDDATADVANPDNDEIPF